MVLLWFSVVCFWCQSFYKVSSYVCLYCFSSVWVAEWPLFGKDLLTRLTICSLCILTICKFSYFFLRAVFWVLIALVPVNGICVTFPMTKFKQKIIAWIYLAMTIYHESSLIANHATYEELAENFQTCLYVHSRSWGGYFISDVDTRRDF